jgi:hypothetical protein
MRDLLATSESNFCGPQALVWVSLRLLRLPDAPRSPRCRSITTGPGEFILTPEGQVIIIKVAQAGISLSSTRASRLGSLRLNLGFRPILLKKSREGGLVSFNPRVNDESIRMNSMAYAYASITGEIFIAEGVFQQNRP